MWLIEFLLLAYFFYVVGYTFLFSLAGLWYRHPQQELLQHKKFCILIPCYKEDGVILEVANKSLNQTYSNYRVVVIADSLQPATLLALRKLPIEIIEVTFETSTKVKALNAALNKIENNFDCAVILDADNVMAPDFLDKINCHFNKETLAIQGQRKPKNTTNSLSLLDGVSEAINNHIYRQGTVALGLSSAISGSGVAFNFNLLKNTLATMSSVGGFDRELELLIIQQGSKVNYLKSAIVYDEKVSKAGVFQNQRKRWISSQYFYLRKYFYAGCKALLKGEITFFNSAVLRNIQLPRLLNIGILTALTISLYFFRETLALGYSIWLLLFVLNTFAILIAIPKEFYTFQLLRSVLKLPFLFIKMFLLLFKLKNANKKFIHTPHGAN
ncbi:MAG: glycosyltransferase family 2 protein [Cyclobacteriaceae bacterium]|nr:glycosyltransferase family 2 protein [Cyclobacteriaceae bacterium]